MSSKYTRNTRPFSPSIWAARVAEVQQADPRLIWLLALSQNGPVSAGRLGGSEGGCDNTGGGSQARPKAPGLAFVSEVARNLWAVSRV